MRAPLYPLQLSTHLLLPCRGRHDLSPRVTRSGYVAGEARPRCMLLSRASLLQHTEVPRPRSVTSTTRTRRPPRAQRIHLEIEVVAPDAGPIRTTTHGRFRCQSGIPPMRMRVGIPCACRYPTGYARSRVCKWAWPWGVDKGADAAVAEADVDKERVARERAALDVGIVPSL